MANHTRPALQQTQSKRPQQVFQAERQPLKRGLVSCHCFQTKLQLSSSDFTASRCKTCLHMLTRCQEAKSNHQGVIEAMTNFQPWRPLKATRNEFPTTTRVMLLALHLWPKWQVQNQPKHFATHLQIYSPNITYGKGQKGSNFFSIRQRLPVRFKLPEIPSIYVSSSQFGLAVLQWFWLRHQLKGYYKRLKKHDSKSTPQSKVLFQQLKWWCRAASLSFLENCTSGHGQENMNCPIRDGGPMDKWPDKWLFLLCEENLLQYLQP